MLAHGIRRRPNIIQTLGEWLLFAENVRDVEPANTKHLYNISTTSAQRLRRWSNIVQMLYKCFVLAVVETVESAL